MQPLISLSGVSRDFDNGRIVALSGVDLTLHTGECLALVGRSGSGKSCLLNMATGLDRPDKGTVSWRGQPLYSLSSWAELRRESIGIVFQEFLLLPTLTALQNIEIALLAGNPHGKGRDAARAILERVDLGRRLDSLPSQLSGGERQRVAIARALVREPDILFADEPTGNLDSTNAARIADLLFELHGERGMALVVVTHDEELAERCPRVVRLADGRISEDRPGKGKL